MVRAISEKEQVHRPIGDVGNTDVLPEPAARAPCTARIDAIFLFREDQRRDCFHRFDTASAAVGWKGGGRQAVTQR
jgi:hypothetical protein